MRRGLEYITQVYLPEPVTEINLPVLDASCFKADSDDIDLKAIAADEESLRGLGG